MYGAAPSNAARVWQHWAGRRGSHAYVLGRRSRGGGASPPPALPPPRQTRLQQVWEPCLCFGGRSRGGLAPPLPGKRVRSTPQSWCQKWLNSEKTVSGHVKKKKTLRQKSLKLRERLIYMYLRPPATCCHVPFQFGAATLRQSPQAAPRPANLYVEKSPPIFSNSVLWTLLQGQ